MLHRLTIRDFVLVDRLDLEFDLGFGALTGETGAGKSILVDALAFTLGERVDSGVVRSGCERAEVSAEFDLSPPVADWLVANDFDVGESLLLRRLIDAGGRSRGYINGSPATLQQLREVGESLVDIHGQHAHQSLLRAEAQRALLDAHGGLDALRAEVGAAHRAWRAAVTARQAALENAEALIAERERLDWQVRELERLGFAADEWEALNQEHRRLAHATGLIDGVRGALALIADDDSGEGATRQIDRASERIDALVEVDPALAEIAGLLRSAQAELADASSQLRRYADRIDLDPQRLAEVERRIEATLDCARKYRVAPEELPALLVGGRARLAEIGDAADLAALDARVAAGQAHYQELAGRLSAARSETAERLASAVSRVMQQLALGGGRFEIALLPIAAGSAKGNEQVEFRIAGLAGGEARSLAKVASGGELSRISLAIQVIASQAAQVPTLVFDEVDVGIGGGVAEVVGRLLRELGDGRQVLCVTHLPQVAARAGWQWRVVKERGEDGIRSRLVQLDADGRVEEIARMLGGVEITAITRQHAREMLGY